MIFSTASYSADSTSYEILLKIKITELPPHSIVRLSSSFDKCTANTEWIITTVNSSAWIMRITVATDAVLRRRPSFQTACLVDVVLTVILSVLYPSPSTLVADARVVANQLSQRIVTTRYGQLRGISVTLPVSAGVASLPPVEAYLGVEYGSVLGGELRFMPPTSPVTRWDGVRSALKFRPVCPQHIPAALTAPSGGDRTRSTVNAMPHKRVEQLRRLKPFLERQNEECLSLNIYVPVTDRNSTKQPAIPAIPVVLFVHGFSYEIGTGNAYDGSVLAAYGRIIVITMNYRLGVLGFLSTGDRYAPGNYALLDIVAALHWIADNIRAFGGDPDEVTLFGEDHGAALVNLLLLSPVTRGKGLFRRAIMHGGSALPSWALSDDVSRYTQLVASRLNCSRFADAGLLLHCLKQFTVADLIEASIGPAFKYLPRFGPIVDGHWLVTSSPRELMSGCRDNVWPSIPLMIGSVETPGFGFLTSQTAEAGISEWDMTRQLRTYVQNTFRHNRQTVFDVLAHNYAEWEWPRNPMRVRDQMAALLGDGQVLVPIVEAARYHASCRHHHQQRQHQQQQQQQQQVVDSASTYLYTLELADTSDWYRSRGANRTGDGGASSSTHTAAPSGDELAYMFGSPLVGGIDPFTGYSTNVIDRVMAETVLTYLTNFIRTSDPNNQSNANYRHVTKSNTELSMSSRKQWPTYELSGQRFLCIGPGGATVNHHLRSDKMALWLELVPRLQRHEASGADPSFDWLEDADNMTSYDVTGGTRLVGPLLPVPTRRSDVMGPSATQLASAQSTSSHSANQNDLSFTAPPSDNPRTTSEIAASHHRSIVDKLDHVTVVASVTSTRPFKTEPEAVSVGAMWTIRVTAAVGVLMATLNAVVFVAAACQWRRLRQLRRRTANKRLQEQFDLSLSNNCLGNYDVSLRQVKLTGDEHVSRPKQPSTNGLDNCQPEHRYMTTWLTCDAANTGEVSDCKKTISDNYFRCFQTIPRPPKMAKKRFVDVRGSYPSSTLSTDRRQHRYYVTDDRLDVQPPTTSSPLTVKSSSLEIDRNPPDSSTSGCDTRTRQHLLLTNGTCMTSSSLHVGQCSCNGDSNGRISRRDSDSCSPGPPTAGMNEIDLSPLDCGTSPAGRLERVDAAVASPHGDRGPIVVDVCVSRTGSDADDDSRSGRQGAPLQPNGEISTVVSSCLVNIADCTSTVV